MSRFARRWFYSREEDAPKGTVSTHPRLEEMLAAVTEMRSAVGGMSPTVDNMALAQCLTVLRALLYERVHGKTP